MRRLSFAIIYTERFDEMKAFYADQVGLPVRLAEGDWIEFDTGGAALALQRSNEAQKQGIALRLQSEDLELDVETLSKRGVQFTRPVRDLPWGRFAEFRDAEDNRVGLIQTKRTPSEGTASVDRVVLNCRSFGSTAAFYRERVGLRPAVESDRWLEYDTGDTRLALHPRAREDDHPPHTEQNISVVFGADDLMAWVEAMRGRGIHFATAPIEEDFGLYAEATDPDGYMVVFREPPPPASIEEELAQAFEVDDVPHHVAIRKPAQKPSNAGLVIASTQAQARREKEIAKREADEASAAARAVRKLQPRLVSPRGTGEAGARQKPKREHDPKRARAKPAIGSLKEAGRKTTARKKRAVARASKTVPVKKAVSGGRTRKAAPPRGKK